MNFWLSLGSEGWASANLQAWSKPMTGRSQVRRQAQSIFFIYFSNLLISFEIFFSLALIFYIPTCAEYDMLFSQMFENYIC